MRFHSKNIFIVTIVCLSFFVTSAAIFYASIRNRANRLLSCNGRAEANNLLIVASHPDDDVIIGGGYAIQTIKSGGDVTVLLITGNSARFSESVAAWEIAGLPMSRIIRLKVKRMPHLDLKGLRLLEDRILGILKRLRPDLVLIPMYEGGHIEHDLTNFVTSAAVARYDGPIRLFEAPEYNFYFSFRNTPEKILDGLDRVVPFAEFRSPPTFISTDSIFNLCMDAEELELKRKMLEQFTSQNPQVLLEHFGYPDRFQPYRPHNYDLPPHNHGSPLVKWLREGPIFWRFFARPYWNMTTIFDQHGGKKLGPLFPLRKPLVNNSRTYIKSED